MANVLRHVTEDDRERGLYPKYSAYRLDAEGREGERIDSFFLLRVGRDPFAVEALRAYAAACQHRYPALAMDPLKWAWQAEQATPESRAAAEQLEAEAAQRVETRREANDAQGDS